MGYKKSRAEFADLMYKVMTYAGTSTSDTTKSPTGIEVGLGVRPTAVNKIFTEGSLKQTDNTLDLAITGKGFSNFSFQTVRKCIPVTDRSRSIKTEHSSIQMAIP